MGVDGGNLQVIDIEVMMEKFSNSVSRKRCVSTHLDLLSISRSGENISKRLGGILGCTYKTS